MARSQRVSGPGARSSQRVSTGKARPSDEIRGASSSIAATGSRVERGGHHEDAQVGTERAARLPCQGEAEIGVEGAFVELVEDDRADARQVGGVLHHPGQDAFGHDLDPGGVRHLRLAPDAVAHGPPARLAQHLGHAFGGGAGGKAARLQHHDAALGPGGEPPPVVLPAPGGA
jgi:hypothetical protein